MINFYNQKHKNGNGDAPEGGAARAKDAANGTEEIPVVKKSIKDYQAQDGVGSKELKFGIWFSRHKVLNYRVLLGLFILFDAVVVLFSLWKIGSFLLYDFTKKDRMEAELTYFANHSVIHERYQPESIKILETKAFSGGTDQVDAIAKLANPNDDFVVKFDYSFSFSGRETEIKRGFILPGQEGVVVELGLPSDEFIGTPQVHVGNFSWVRVPAHDVSDAVAWQNDRLDFTISDLEFVYAGQSSGADANIIKFNLTNNTAFSYRDPLFIAEFKYSGVSTGLTQFNVERLMSQEVRPMDLRNFVDNLQVNELILYPMIDVYDPAEYISPRK